MTHPMSPGRPHDPREERFRPMGEFLQAETVAVIVLALVALLAPGDLGGAAATGMIVLLIGIPVVRVLWLVGRWFRRGDTRFALVGVMVLVVLAGGFALSR